MNKGLPFTLTGSKVTDLAGKSPSTGRVGYQLDGDNHFLIGNGTSSPYEYPTVNKTIKLINDAIAASGGGGGTSTGTLVTTPVITGAVSVAANTNVTLTASGSHSALEDDARVTVKYVWTKPDNSVAEGSSVTVTSSTTVGGTVTVKCKAVDSLGNASAISTFVITTIAAVNNPPTAPAVVSDFPATIVRSSSYTLKFSSTDQDGDAVTFSIVGLIGCTASVMSGITAATGTVITIDSQADSVSVSIKAVDSKGAQSTSALVLSKTGSSITNPTGTTGYLTAGQHIVNIPDWADTATLTGNGGAGGAITCANDPYGQPYTFISAELLAAATYAGSDADVQYKYTWDVAYVDAYANHGFRVINDTMTKPLAGCYRNYTNTSSMRYYALLNAATSAGESTTVVGAVAATFFGGAAGSTTPPAQTNQIKTLTAGTNRTLTVTIPDGGTFKADWS